MPTAYSIIKWLGARGGVPKLARGSPSFLSDPTKSDINIVEWLELYANVLDFRYVFALSNYGANCLRLGMKNDANLGFFAPPPFVLGDTLKKSVYSKGSVEDYRA